MNDIGRCYFEAGKLKRAREFFEKALLVSKKNASRRKAVHVRILANLSATICYLEGCQHAEKYVDEALAVSKQIEDKSQLLKTIGKLANIVANQKDYKEADKLYKQAIELEKNYYGKDSHLAVKTLSDASDFYRRRKNYALAEKYGKEALSLSNKYYGNDSKHSAMLLCHLGLLYGKKGEAKKSREYMRRGTRGIEETLGDEHPALGIELLHLGEELVQEKSYRDAIPIFQRSSTILENCMGVENPHLCRTYLGLGGAYFLKGDNLLDAEIYYKKALAIQEAISGDESVKLLVPLKSLKKVKEKMNDREAVANLNNRIKDLEESDRAMR